MAQFEEFIIKLKDQFSGGLRDADAALDDTRESADGLNDSFGKMVKIAGGIAVALGISEIANATKEFNKLRNIVTAYTGANGAATDDMVTTAKTIADTYDTEATAVLTAANTLTKQMGGTMESNLALIVQGFKKGANVNGEFLDTLREYPAQFRAAGLSAAESIALITDGAKKGVYSDKAADTIKEMTLSLREMTQIQRDALTGIGIDSSKLFSEMNSGLKSPFQAMQQIVGEMDKFDMVAQQTVIADIFKGAGEDAGIQFIKGLKDIDLNLDNISDSGSGFTDVMFQLNGMINKITTSFMSGLMPVATQFGQFILDNVPLLKGLAAALGFVAVALGVVKVATFLATLATGGFNAMLLANPIVLIVAAIAALIAGLVYAYFEFETFRKIVDGVFKLLKIVGSYIGTVFVQIWDTAVMGVNMFMNAFQSIYPQIKAVFLAIGKFIMKYHPIALLINGLKSMFPEFFDSLVKKFTKAFSYIGKMFAKIKSFFGFGDDGIPIDLGGKTDENDGNQDSPTLPTGSLTGGGMISTATSAGNLKSGISGMSNTAPKQFNINIDKLIENFTVATERIEQSRDQIRDIVLETLLTAVNDVQSSVE
tara:strand:- start:3627 stop:5417 length:1791 start_codon:yes stop_codon:yes gene_type:complete